MTLERNTLPALMVAVATVMCTVSCRDAAPREIVEKEPWSVTAWGERYEVFPEVDPLIAEETFGASSPVRAGIFTIDVKPRSPGEYDLLFRIDAAPGSEEIPGGVVRVGSAEAPGGVSRAELPTEPFEAGEPISFSLGVPCR